MSEKNKNYKVIVKGKREVKVQSAIDPVVYHLPAENREQAITAAREKFEVEYPGVIDVEPTIKNNKLIMVSIICLAFACFLSLIPWYLPDGSVFSLSPISIMSMLFSIAIYFGLFIRSKGIKGIKNAFFSGIPEALGSILIIVIIASFISLLSRDINIPIFSYTLPTGRQLDLTLPIPGRYLLIFVVLFTWLVIPKIANLVWIALFILAAYRLLSTDSAMGIWGWIYLLLALLGIVLHLLSDFLQEPSPGFIGFMKKRGNFGK